MGAVEQQGGKVARKDLRWREGGKGCGLAAVPEADCDAGFRPSRAAGALIGRGARDPHRLQPGDPGCGFKDRQPLQAAVDDDAHAVDGDRGLGDRGGKHDLARALGRRADRRILLLLGQVAVERHNGRVCIEAVLEPRGDTGDLGLAGQEGEDGAVFRAVRFSNGAHHGILDILPAAVLVANVDRIAAALALYDRRAAEQA
ncbi:hypothetical protein D9M72_445470 [compost metagenome]